MIDAYTDTWRAVAAKASETIDQCRSRLEQHDQNFSETQFLRGRISACREILAMATPAVVKKTATPHELRPRDRSGV